MKNLRARVSKLTGADAQAAGAVLDRTGSQRIKASCGKSISRLCLCAWQHRVGLLSFPRQSGALTSEAAWSPPTWEDCLLLVLIPAPGMRPEQREPPHWLRTFWDALAMSAQMEFPVQPLCLGKSITHTFPNNSVFYVIRYTEYGTFKTIYSSCMPLNYLRDPHTLNLKSKWARSLVRLSQIRGRFKLKGFKVIN